MSAAEHEPADADDEPLRYAGRRMPKLGADVLGQEDGFEIRIDAAIAHAIDDLAAETTLTKGQAARELLRSGMEARSSDADV